jgi:hypothetical protein
MKKLMTLFATFTFVALSLLSAVMLSSESSCCVTGMTSPPSTFLTPIKIADASDNAAEENDDKNKNQENQDEQRLWDTVLLG